jgi:hypothetical protein
MPDAGTGHRTGGHRTLDTGRADAGHAPDGWTPDGWTLTVDADSEQGTLGIRTSWHHDAAGRRTVLLWAAHAAPRCTALLRRVRVERRASGSGSSVMASSHEGCWRKWELRTAVGLVRGGQLLSRILGRRLLNVCVKFSEDEVESGVRSTSTDTLSDQLLSEWPVGLEADRTSAQGTAAVGLTDRGSLSEFALMADRPLRLADDDCSDLGGLRRSLTGATFLNCGAHALLGSLPVKAQWPSFEAAGPAACCQPVSSAT